MASTNKTANYELSQFLGTDKPAWLSDYNQDMTKIDTQMKANADGVTAASGSASSANTAIGTLANLTTTAKTDLVSAVNEVDSNADTAYNTASQAVTTGESNSTAITALTNYLNLSTFTTPTVSVSGGTISSAGVHCASNSDGSLGKVYGWIRCTASSNTVTLTFPTPLRPTEQITINGLVVNMFNDEHITPKDITIGTDGTATIVLGDTTSGMAWRLNLVPCLIFAKSFGDVPTPE